MFNRIHQKLGTAGFIISVVALVAALGGGAYAASGGLNGKQKKEVEKIAKKYAGAPGANGTNGANGAKGDTGTNGTNGAKGETGSQGNPGTNGKSVTATPIASGGPKCEERGGVEVKQEGAASGAQVCNGEPGILHPDETLPSGATETGTFVFTGRGGHQESEPEFAPISFAIPLSPADAGAIQIHYWEEEGGVVFADPQCTGTPNEPKAEAGSICLYLPTAGQSEYFRTGGRGEHPFLHKPDFNTSNGIGTSGAFFRFFNVPAGEFLGGSWALTAP